MSHSATPLGRWCNLIAKWAGFCMCLTLTAIFLVSGWWCLHSVFVLGTTGCALWTDHGRIYFDWSQIEPTDITDRWPSCSAWQSTEGWPDFSLPYLLNFETQGPPRSRVGLSILPVILAALAPTLVLWRRGRRIPAGYCTGCGYNLLGNISGTCPECRRSVGFAKAARPRGRYFL